MTAQATAAPPAHRLVRRPPPVPPQQLSDPQLQVAKHRDGPLLVVGGPGAGKTAALVESVVARAVEGADPERILVLTFGRRGAQRLRARISARIGAKIGVSGEPAVRTFHGHAFGLLRLLAARRGEPPPRLLTGPEQDLVIRELLAAGGGDVGWPAALRPALRTRGFAGELRDLLSRASERGLGPAGLSELGRRLGREDWVAAGRFAQQYGDVLALRDGAARGSIGYDTSELIRAASAALIADPAAHAEERRRHQFTYVDELHDTDPAQLELLELTAGGGAHLVGFGDPDSSIFGFRGADPEGVLAFPERFRSVAGAAAPTIALLDNWRAAPTLRQAVDRVASRLRGPGRRRLRRTESVSPGQADAAVLKIADSGTNLQSEATPAPEIEILADGGDVAEPAGGGQIEVRLLRSRPQEAAHIAYQLRAAHLLDKVPWSRMAVLMRSAGQQLAGMRRALAQAGVPVRVEAEDLPLAAQPVVASLLSLVRCGLRPERLDEEAAVALLHSPFGGADPLAERRLRQGLRAQAIAAGEAKPSGALLVEALADPTELAAVSERWAKPAARVAELLQVVRDADEAGASAEDVLWAVWKASGLSERWGAASARGGHRGAAADRDLDAIVALFDAAAWFASRLPGAGAEVFSEHVMGQQLPADTLAPTADQGDAVRLLTVHAAKGLEWDLVVIPGVQEGRWPDLRLRGSVLGSEQLVDHLAGRAAPGEGWRPVTARLDEERRLFHVAISRARQRLIVTAVASGDAEEQPSRFLDELTGAVADAAAEWGLDQPAPQLATASAGLSLSVLAAQLRGVAADPDATDARRRAAARQLARLAAADVPGAHPDQWWGLRPLSDPAPLSEGVERVQVSPSVVEQVRRCGLRWLLERHGGSGPPGPEQGIGNLVHSAAELLDPGGADPQAMYRYLDQHWGVIEVAARWEEGRKREQAEKMLDRLVSFIAQNPRELLAVERGFRVTLPGGDGPAGEGPAGEGLQPDVEVVGVVDRIERDATGRLVVIDLKTGKSVPTSDEVQRHPQLGTYQLAVALGGFAELAGAETSGTQLSGGAALVQLGKDRRGGPEQRQLPLAEAEDPGWAEGMVREAAEAMSGSSFSAQVNQHCAVCAVQTSCPVSEHGRQVVEPPPPETGEPGDSGPGGAELGPGGAELGGGEGGAPETGGAR